jgi:hypothetical protein
MDDPDFPEAAANRLEEVFLNDNMDFPGLECVQVDVVFDRDVMHNPSI